MINFQQVRYRNELVHIQTVNLNHVEYLFLDDVQQRFPSVTSFLVDNVQMSFVRDKDGNYLRPFRIVAVPNKIIETVEPVHGSVDTLSTLVNHLDSKLDQMSQKTDLILANTQETLLRIKHVMTQIYELQEFTTPRYFFILPTKSCSWNTINSIQNCFLLHYKLYFLCECSNDPDQLHIAPHDGYLVKKPSEFIAKYGCYLRATLSIARNVLSVGGFLLPQIENRSILLSEKLTPLTKEPHHFNEVDQKLNLVETILNKTDQDLIQVDSTSFRQVSLPKLSFQGAQLRELEAFLDEIDHGRSLGNLYRTITDDGHVRWVCAEHANAAEFNNKISDFIRQCESMGGNYSRSNRELFLSGNLTTKNIETLCHALTNGFNVLTIIFDKCSFCHSDSDRLFEVLINRSSVRRFILLDVEIRKWRGIDKFTCEQLVVQLRNQSIQFQFYRSARGQDARTLCRLLNQNQICRSLEFFGFDFIDYDPKLIQNLRSRTEPTTLIINQPVSNRFLNELLSNSSSIRRLKLCFSLTNFQDLCRPIESNQSLAELDLIDHTAIDDFQGLNELVKIIQRHVSIQSFQFHLDQIEPSNQRETLLISTLQYDTFITRLRISNSTISDDLVTALIYACQSATVLTHVEFYQCRFQENTVETLQLAQASEQLLHLTITDQSFLSTFIDAANRNRQTDSLPYRNVKLEQKINEFDRHSSICLDQMKLIDQDMEIVIERAIKGKQCQVLSLQSSKFTIVSIANLAEVLRSNETLETLFLNNSHITDDGVYFLAQVLANENRSLKNLVLQNNEITDRGVKYLAEMLQTNRTLTWLYLGENRLTNDGVRLLMDSLADEEAVLEMLVLSSNHQIDDGSFESIQLMLKKNRHLKKLWIENCNLSETVKASLSKNSLTRTDFYVRV